MEQELQLVADFDFDMIVDFFSRLNRQGPGSQQVTRQALSFIGAAVDKPSRLPKTRKDRSRQSIYSRR